MLLFFQAMTMENGLQKIAYIDISADEIKNTDTEKYYVFNIGHNVEDSGGYNKRFVTDGWVYIDSLTKKYELNVQSDSLMHWEGQILR